MLNIVLTKKRHGVNVYKTYSYLGESAVYISIWDEGTRKNTTTVKYFDSREEAEGYILDRVQVCRELFGWKLGQARNDF